MLKPQRQVIRHGKPFARFCERLLLHPSGPLRGQPYILPEFWVDVYDELLLQYAYDGHGKDGAFIYDEAFLGLPRGNAKSEIASAVDLYVLTAMREYRPEIYCAATSREQAMVIFNGCKAFLESSPALADFVVQRRWHIECPANKGVILALHADPKTLQGLKPKFISFDETHEVLTPKLVRGYGALASALEKKGGLLANYTTAGYDLTSLLAQRVEQGKEAADGGVEEMRRRGLYYRWYGAPDGCEITTENIRLANPAPWVDVDKLLQRSKVMHEHEFRRYHLNQWVAGGGKWLNPADWQACKDAKAEIPRGVGTPVHACVDLGMRKDTTAIAWIWKRGENDYVCDGLIIKAKPGQKEVSIADVEEALRLLHEWFYVISVDYDPWRLKRSAQDLTNEGMVMVESPMSPNRMIPATEETYDAIVGGMLTHPGRPELDAQMYSAGIQPTRNGPWLCKDPDNPNPMDFAVALSKAYYRARSYKKKTWYAAVV